MLFARFLHHAGEGQEFEHMDLGTVTGYTACVMCTEVCEEVEACLGYEDNVCSELLLNMCRDRLVPTPWLNQVRCNPTHKWVDYVQPPNDGETA